LQRLTQAAAQMREAINRTEGALAVVEKLLAECAPQEHAPARDIP